MISLADGIGLLIGIVVIATVADRLRIAYPILLVIAGIAVALIPTHHRIQLQPDLVLLVFLPPLIYDASLDTSARELRAHLRPILLLAVGLVIATMVVVAVVIHTLVGSLGLGGGLRPRGHRVAPDSVAATQIAGKLGLPRRLVTILGGEGLMNDATALTAYQVAVAAVGSAFTLADVAGKFVFAVIVGVAIGLAVGWFGSRMLRFTETPVIENTMLLILPFAAYLPADKVGASGVLAVVAAGLYFGRYGSVSLTAGARLQQREIWDLIVFLLTGMSFLLVELKSSVPFSTAWSTGSRARWPSRPWPWSARSSWSVWRGCSGSPPCPEGSGSSGPPTAHRHRGGRPRWSADQIRGAVSLGRVARPSPELPPAGSSGVPDLRGHRGHAGGAGADPPSADPPARPGHPGRSRTRCWWPKPGVGSPCWPWAVSTN